MTSVRWVAGYGTNGFADHTLADALDVIAGEGYAAIALTIGHPHLDPFAVDWRERADELAAELRRRSLRVVVETGARYLLDPRRKHRPTLVDVDAEPRMRLLRRAIDIAAVLDADCVSLWSGAVPDGIDASAAERVLVDRLAALADDAQARGVRLSIEPEPGMHVETVADALRVRTAIGAPRHVGITVDLGHCLVVEPEGVQGALRAAAPHLFNVQVDDMTPDAHEHLELGAGTLDLAAAFRTLGEIGYEGVAAIELPRHSHDAPRLARASMAAMRAAADLPHPWMTSALRAVRADPAAVPLLFASAGREVARGAARDDVTSVDAARAALIGALADIDPDGARRATSLYRHGDRDERRGALAGFNELAARDGVLDETWSQSGLAIVRDALRTNDPTLVTVAMGRFAEAWLPDAEWRQGVLKLMFMGVPLSAVSGLARRRDAELTAMAVRFAAERRAADRDVPADVGLLIDPSGAARTAKE